MTNGGDFMRRSKVSWRNFPLFSFISSFPFLSWISFKSKYVFIGFAEDNPNISHTTRTQNPEKYKKPDPNSNSLLLPSP